MKPSRIDHFCKLDRAARHLEELDIKLGAFIQPNCYEIVNESENIGEIPSSPSEPRRSRLKRRVVFKSAPPLLHWGTIVGDIVQNLRSALDHIVFTISYRRDPSVFGNDNSTAFPICDSPSEFRGPKRKSWQEFHETRGLPDEARAIIEGLQPYQRGDTAMLLDPLRILREMNDIDKHRTIHLTGWSAHSLALDITYLPRGARVHSLNVRPAGAIESGEVLAEIEFSAPEDVPAFYMDKEFLFTVAFDEGTPLAGQQVQTALYGLAVYVEGILNALHRFVPAKIKR